MFEKIVTIFGTSRAKPGDAIFQLAFQLGSELAGAGFTTANGGYGGTMTASAKAATEAGGKTIGVICSAFDSAPNEYITRQIATETLTERLDKLIELGDGYIVLPGGTGTLLELAKVWELQNKNFITRAKPIIIIGDFWQKLLDAIAIDDAGAIGIIKKADTAAAAKDILLECLKK